LNLNVWRNLERHGNLLILEPSTVKPGIILISVYL
jgi:hypothetical protein